MISLRLTPIGQNYNLVTTLPANLFLQRQSKTITKKDVESYAAQIAELITAADSDHRPRMANPIEIARRAASKKGDHSYEGYRKIAADYYFYARSDCQSSECPPCYTDQASESLKRAQALIISSVNLFDKDYLDEKQRKPLMTNLKNAGDNLIETYKFLKKAQDAFLEFDGRANEVYSNERKNEATTIKEYLQKIIDDTNKLSKTLASSAQ
jgi:hypothetical protein